MMMRAHKRFTMFAVAVFAAVPFQSFAQEATETFVSVKSEALIGSLPTGQLANVNLFVQVEGSDPSTLTGEGRHFASTGAHNYWPCTGSTDGSSVVLSGVVTDANFNGILIGSPVAVQADASTGAITLVFGPLTGGPYVGQTLVFSGTGQVKISIGK
jgi:hypothetical protein